MRTLKLSNGTFDRESMFRVEGVRGNVSLHKDKEKIGDGVFWGMQHGVILQSHYSEEDKAHNQRMRESIPIQNDEKVMIEDKVYKSRVLGNYSDCVVFDYVREPSKSRVEVEKLKKEWESDPCWDLYETEGFEDYQEELEKYQEECESYWQMKRNEEEKLIDVKANDLGIEGLYRLILKHDELLKNHSEAIDALSEGDTTKAYNILRKCYN